MQMPQMHLPNMHMPQMQTPFRHFGKLPQVESTNMNPRHMEGEKFGMLEPNDTSKSGAIEAFAGGSVEHTSGGSQATRVSSEEDARDSGVTSLRLARPRQVGSSDSITVSASALVQSALDDNPGVDEAGRPFHPIGEVFAEQIRLRHRPAPVMQIVEACVIQQRGSPCRSTSIVPPDDLQVGDTCYALGQMVSKKWFGVLIGGGGNSPPMRVKYISTLDGNTTDLLLPSPRRIMSTSIKSAAETDVCGRSA